MSPWNRVRLFQLAVDIYRPLPCFRRETVIGNQVPVHEPLALWPLDDSPHLLDGVKRSDVMAATELVDVALQVLGAHPGW